MVSELDTQHQKVVKGCEVVNKAKLKSVMTLHGDTNKDLAELLGISEQSVSCKINENGTEFKQGEISKIAAKYLLSPDDVVAIFFG